jgi:hypothetical protein
MKKIFKFLSIKRILVYLLFALIIIQVIPVDKSLPSADPKNDFITFNQTPAAEAQLLKNACYDCHSNHTKYPWYAKVAPISMWIQGHVNHARDELNFSLWNSYSDKRKDHKLEESIELIQEQEMPLKSYTLIHSEARLTQSERDLLIQYFKGLR